ncbi:hypothetical protein VIN01S_10960 [Vibrio inusitatus NBRC 102082]|uniref:Uncharacterized protein n=1 Tax=Vibrio inusitatus NBRC 102082 TaxID=1219070 RepID=A0A4Y3HU60_9VIBR|nr:hypothetical protein [Vibrio inusitatus]GEA50292.1 hypothetical protein VIN01S_10960 [Vibrio inusitatus NBRC 102082]
MSSSKGVIASKRITIHYAHKVSSIVYLLAIAGALRIVIGIALTNGIRHYHLVILGS